MDVVQAIWLSSMTGAGLFFSAGLLARTAVEARRRRADEPASPSAEAQIAAFSRAAERASRELADERARSAALEAARAEEARLRAEEARLRAEEVRLRAQDHHEIARLTQLVDRQQAEAIQLRAVASTRGVDAKPLRDEIERLRARVTEKSGEIEQMKSSSAGAEAELSHARRAVAAIQAELAQARSELGGVRAALAASEGRAAEAVRLREENGALRGKIDAFERRGGEGREQLEPRVRELEARGFARRPPALPASPRGVTPSKRSERLEAALERHLDALVRSEPGLTAAILTDVGGLLIAASAGVERRDELGAAASLVSSAAERVRQVLPFEDPACFQILDRHRVVFRTVWLRAEEELFLVSTLGIAPDGAGALAEDERALLSRLSGSS